MISPTHVNVKVHRALNLKTKGKAGTNDAYVLIQVGAESYKTSVKERTLEPVWNEEYMFPLPMDLRSSDVIRVSVFHRSLLSLDELLGLIEIPLYKIRVREGARVRRYALHEKSTLRSSFGKAGRTRHRVPDTLDSPSTDGGGLPGGGSGSLTPVTPDNCPSPEPPRSEDKGTGEIELTIAFTTETAENIHSDLLRPRSAAGLDYEDAWLRRNSLPHSFHSSEDDWSGDEKRRSGNSFKSILDVPKNFFSSALRRSAASSKEDLTSVDSPSEVDDKEALSEVDDKEALSEGGNHVALSRTERDDICKATNNTRPTDIQIIVAGSQSSSPVLTPASSVVSDSYYAASLEGNMAASESSMTASENNVEGSERQERRQREASPHYQNEDDDEINNHTLHNQMKKERRKLPGFMTIDSLEKLHKYQPNVEEVKLFSGFERDDLVSTVIRQHARLSLAETYIGDLEHYINLLVHRVMDSQPRLLQNPVLRQHSDPTPRSAIARLTKKTLRKSLGGRL